MENINLELFKIEFREYLTSFYIAQIDDFFKSGGFQKLKDKSQTRRDQVERYYELINWSDDADLRKFLKVIENLLLYQNYNFTEEYKEQLRLLCKKCGFEVDSNGYTLYLNNVIASNLIKNIIFASNYLKPGIVFSDALNNDIEIVENEQYCLVYDRPIQTHGLLWHDLVNWYKEYAGIKSYSDSEAGDKLYTRLQESMKGNTEELMFFETYYTKLYPRFQKKLPALVPQVYLHYDPYTIKELKRLNKQKRLKRQRMDFLILFSNLKRVVIEIDGMQHYSDANGKANSATYTQMVEEDRRLKFLGYDIYRFSCYELRQPNASQIIDNFFLKLFSKYDIESEF